MWETWVRSLGWEDPLVKEMTTLFSILVWTTPWTEGSGTLQSIGSQRVWYDWSDWAYTYNQTWLLVFIMQSFICLSVSHWILSLKYSTQLSHFPGYRPVFKNIGYCCNFLYLPSAMHEIDAVFDLPVFPGGSDGKVSAYNVGDLGSIPGLGRSTGGGRGNPLQ